MAQSDDTQTDDQFQTNDPNEVNPASELADKEKLPAEEATPFSPPDGVQDRVPDTHPRTDSNMDSHEHYDAGREAASGTDFPGEAADEASKSVNDIETR